MVHIETLKHIAALGAMEKTVKISSSELAGIIVTSPQTAARHLQTLEKNNLIERQTTTSGQWINLTSAGIQRLEEEYRFYQQLFKTKTPKIIKGTVITGLGEGQYYISNEGYKKQIEQKLGFTPYPGTLNIKLDSENTLIRRSLDAKKGIVLEGFTSENRTFGGGVCFPIKIKDIKGAIIQPERTHYPPDIIEVIAPINLREKLNLQDGSTIKVNIE
jgi:riboflavin kinase